MALVDRDLTCHAGHNGCETDLSALTCSGGLLPGTGEDDAVFGGPHFGMPPPSDGLRRLSAVSLWSSFGAADSAGLYGFAQGGKRRSAGAATTLAAALPLLPVETSVDETATLSFSVEATGGFDTGTGCAKSSSSPRVNAADIHEGAATDISSPPPPPLPSAPTGPGNPLGLRNTPGGGRPLPLPIIGPLGPSKTLTPGAPLPLPCNTRLGPLPIPDIGGMGTPLPAPGLGGIPLPGVCRLGPMSARGGEPLPGGGIRGGRGPLGRIMRAPPAEPH